MDRRKQLVPAIRDANLARDIREMSYPAESSLGRRASAGLFEPQNGLPASKQIHSAWLSAGIATLDDKGAIVSVNDELASWIGQKPVDLTGRSLGEALSARDGECAKKVIDLWQKGAGFAQADVAGASRAQREWFSIELTRTPGGGVVRIASQLPPLYELGESEWDAFLGSDTSRRNMYMRLLRAEAQLDNWVNRWPGVMFSQRADFSFTFISSTVEGLTGIPPEDFKKPQIFWKVVHEADAEDLQQQYRAFSTSNRRLVATYRIRHAQTGRISYIFEHREALYSSNGLLLGYEGVWLDVTRQTIAEKRLSSAAWKETLAVITMGLAHDFSNIMAGILALSEAFQAQVEKEHPFQEGLMLIKRNAIQGNQMVQRILSLHRGKVGERNYHNLNELVKDTVEVVSKILPKRIEVITDYSTDGLPLYVDAVEFRQVLINLSLNAGDAMPQGGKLKFATALHKTETKLGNVHGAIPNPPVVCLCVSDTGMGIPSRNLDAIFDPFFTTKAMSKGTGLGLYNAKLFADKHRGAISVESRENEGSKFTIWLPQADFTESERDAEDFAGHRHTLLIVGPNGMAEASAKFLREHGYYTVVTPAGQRAVEVLNSPDYQFDGIFSVVTSEDSSPADLFTQVSGANTRLKKFLQIVGCNQDQLDTQLLGRADVVFSTDIPEPEMISKLAKALAPA
jgi:signal transduction histidine kinase